MTPASPAKFVSLRNTLTPFIKWLYFFARCSGECMGIRESLRGVGGFSAVDRVTFLGFYRNTLSSVFSGRG